MTLQAGQAAEQRDERRARRRAELLQGALAALARHGGGATMEQMAAASGVTKPILYRHFGDQQGLADALADFYLAELRAALDIEDASDLRALMAEQLDAGLRVVERHPGLYEFVARQRPPDDDSRERSGAQLSPFIDFIERVLAARGVDAAGAGPIASAMAGAFGQSTLWWIRASDMSREAFVEWIVALLWDGLSHITEGETQEPAR